MTSLVDPIQMESATPFGVLLDERVLELPDRHIPRFQSHRGKIASFVLIVATKCIVKSLAPTINNRLDEAVGVEWCIRYLNAKKSGTSSGSSSSGRSSLSGSG